MGGSGGGGTQSTTNTASYPKEFKPLAKGAADQILAMQNSLPLAGFGQANPGQTAGISPFQQATMNMIPHLLAPSWGLETLQNLGAPMSQLAQNATAAGNPYSTALTALASGGFGGGQQSFPGMTLPPPIPGMAQAAPQSTVAGPGTNGLIAQLMAQLSQPVPSSTPTLLGGITGPVPKT